MTLFPLNSIVITKADNERGWNMIGNANIFLTYVLWIRLTFLSKQKKKKKKKIDVSCYI